jgi:SNF2 family DNA or RNA helicase
VALELSTTDPEIINAIFSIAWSYTPHEIWSDLILLALDRECPSSPFNTHIKKDGLTAYTFVCLFEICKDDTVYKFKRYKELDDKGKQRIRDLYGSNPEEWADFIRFLKQISDRFEWIKTGIRKKNNDDPAPSTPEANLEKVMDKASRSDDADDTSDKETDADGPPPSSAKKKKKRKEVIRNREAAIAREVDQAGAAEREHRRKLLRERLETEGSMALGSQHGRVIVNESKNDGEGFIYIPDDIARQIKEHQVTGVRFMWDQLVVAKKRQGCLLAHTMGLGKTMQIITLLVTIRQASASRDPSIFSQVPEEMRESRTLILCPPTLVNNWMDEILSWLPIEDELGDIFKIDALLNETQRKVNIQTWGVEGGVLIIGYNLFKAFVMKDPQMCDILLKRPSIVVADEAHMMKNPNSDTHVATAKFKTLSRVALTGSPLANNVEEYYSMINWVAPNYLSDIVEFRAQYANPIKMGLDVDSTAQERRRALRMLRVLKSEVSPKVSRITIAVLKHDIPTKKEFVITVPLTPLQRQAYEMFIKYHIDNDYKVPVFAIHDLALICASPIIFLKKLKDMKNQKSSSAGKNETVTLPQQLISDELTLLRNAERDPNFDEFVLSWKVQILFQILDHCKKLGDYVLLFSHSQLTLDYLEKILRRRKLSLRRLDGDTPMKSRQDLVKGFNKGNIDIFLISTKAGSLGLNITGANRVIIFDSKFNPQDEQQAVGRAYRIGQKKPVFVYRFICGGTFEQKMLNQAIWKMQLASRVVDKKNPIPKAQRFNGAWDMPEDPEQEELDKYMNKDIVLDALIKHEEYKNDIRAVQMMDIFEEEALEEAELSAEDRHFADQMILYNEARRSGQPIPAHLVDFANGMIASDGQGLPFSGQPSYAGPPGENQPVLQPSHTGSLDGDQPLPEPFDLGRLGGNQPLPQPSPAIVTTWTNGAPASRPKPNTPSVPHHPRGPSSRPHPHDPRLPPNLLPMQLPGAEVHFRSQAGSSNSASGANDADWDTLSAFEADLTRAFVVSAGFPDEKTRTSVSRIISTAVWDVIHHRTTEEQKAMKWIIMHVASAERFVEALCMGLISPQQLVLMTPNAIVQQAKMWKETDSSEWETKRASWNLQRQLDDPEVRPLAQEHQHDTQN